MLGWTVYISFLGAGALMLLNPANKKAARLIALLAALASFTIALGAVINYKAGSGLVTACKLPWVPSLGINYHLASDGISLTLILLTGIAAVVGILFSWNIEHR